MSTTTRYLKAYLFWGSLFISTLHAASIVEITPSSSSPIAISTNGFTYLTYTIQNKTSKTLAHLTIDPRNNLGTKPIAISLATNSCKQRLLAPEAVCSFSIALQGVNQTTHFQLTPRVCVYNGAVCSVPVLSKRIAVVVTNLVPSSAFPTPYAGTFYPIYNVGPGQWIPPNVPPLPPFNKVSALFVAFAHTYPYKKGALFTFEADQPDEPNRLALLVQTARSENPALKIIISLGWGKNDWTYINNDYINHADIFVPSVIQFIRTNHLDGIDIDDESIGDSTGSIPQEHFDGVIANLRNALNSASLLDKKPYYLTITPAGNNSEPGGIVGTQVDKLNSKSFDLINIQSYFNEEFAQDFFDALIAIGYPKNQIANGIDLEQNCSPIYPPYLNLAGIFSWTMTQDSICSNYSNTKTIANLVGY